MTPECGVPSKNKQGEIVCPCSRRMEQSMYDGELRLGIWKCRAGHRFAFGYHDQWHPTWKRVGKPVDVTP